MYGFSDGRKTNGKMNRTICINIKQWIQSTNYSWLNIVTLILVIFFPCQHLSIIDDHRKT